MKFRLANSVLGWRVICGNVAVPLTRTLSESHPGHELLLPLEGAVVVCFDETETAIRAGEHLCAHYLSDREHSVVNRGNTPAQLLVLRFYE